jgi:hypothetical protein
MDVAGRHDRLRLIAPESPGIKPALNSLLAVAQDFTVTSFHSKCCFILGWLGLLTAIKPRIYQHFELLSPLCEMKSRFFWD